MSYEKQNFKDGEKLKASQLNHMEEGIANASGVLRVDFLRYREDADEFICVNHSNLELYELMKAGTLVMATLWADEIDGELMYIVPCQVESQEWSDSGSHEVWINAGGYSLVHCSSYEGYFVDGNPYNGTAGNELWINT